jgi:hypothetical protein
VIGGYHGALAPIRSRSAPPRLRGLLSVPAGADEARYERAGYVTALRAANSHEGPW